MDGTDTERRRRSFGEILVGTEEKVTISHPAAAKRLRGTRSICTWQPPAVMRAQLPPDFDLTFQCFQSSNGPRQILPLDSWKAFLEWAWAAGFAILCKKQDLSPEQRQSYRVMRFFYLRARTMTEAFGQSFKHTCDLNISLSARRDPKEMDILPADIGLDLRDLGPRWTVKELTKRGAQAARAAGWAQPTMEQCIQYGLLEAARLRPLKIADANSLTLIRSALFNVGPEFDSLDSDFVELVTERIMEALHSHLEDSTPEFNKWFKGGKNSFVHQIAKQKRSRGGVLMEDQVRTVLLSLGWRAYEYMGNCLHTAMLTVQYALPFAMTEQERLIFENMHLRQPYLGNMPLLLLVDRFQFLSPILHEIWYALPDTSLAPVLHRLLDIYGDMAVRRREVDRFRKRGRPLNFVDADHSPTQSASTLQKIAATVRETHRIKCPCKSPGWHAQLDSYDENTMTIKHTCEKCGAEEFTTLPFAELRRLAAR